MILILSSITVVMVFVGGIFAYQQLACYAGVNWSQTTYPAPSETSFFTSRIIIDSVEYAITNRTYCLGLLACCKVTPTCDDADPPVCTCSDTNPLPCKQSDDECIKNYPEEYRDTVNFMVVINYSGSSSSVVQLDFYEESEETYTDENPPGKTITGPVKYLVFSGQTPDKLIGGQQYHFEFSQPIRECSGSNVSFKAFVTSEEVYGVAPAYWEDTIPFCIAPTSVDVNVSVLSLTKKPAEMEADVVINGTAVPYLCPNATVSFKSYDEKGNEIQLYECNYLLNTRSDKWLMDYKLRTTFDVTNNIGTELVGGEEGEAINVTLNFRESQLKLGFPHNMSDCNEIAITERGSDKYLPRWVDPNSMKYECYDASRGNANPVTYDINGDGKVNESDCRCIQADVHFVPLTSISKDNQVPASFDAYFQWDGTEPRPYVLTLEGLAQFLPTYTWNPGPATAVAYTDENGKQYFYPEASSYTYTPQGYPNIVYFSNWWQLNFGKCPP